MPSQIEDINKTLATLKQLPLKKQLDAIIEHPAPLQLVRSMPVPDLLQIIREVGAESCLELVEMLNAEQVQGILDLEIWRTDRLDTKIAGHYLSLLFEADRDTAIAQIHGLDIELIALMLKTVADIYDLTIEEPEDFPELYSTTPGGRFAICFSEANEDRGLAHALYAYIEGLYGRDLPFVLRFLESVRFELASGLEEESLRFQKNRLLEFGILPREERLEYFAPLSLKNIKQLYEKSQAAMNEPPTNLPLKITKEKVDDRYPFLKAALLNNSTKEEVILYELTRAFLNMHASLSFDFGDQSLIEETTDYVKFLLELGLFQECQGEVQKAGEALSKTSIRYLIRLGRTALVGLRRKLIEKTKDEHFIFGIDFCHLDSPLREVAKALSLPEPRYYEGLLEPDKLAVRYFLSFQELNATISAVNEIIFRAELVGPLGLGVSEDALKKHKHLSHANILALSLANAFLKRPQFSAINEDEVKMLLSPDFRSFAENFIEELAVKFSHQTGQNYNDTLDKTRRFFTTILIMLEQNWQLSFK